MEDKGKEISRRSSKIREGEISRKRDFGQFSHERRSCGFSYILIWIFLPVPAQKDRRLILLCNQWSPLISGFGASQVFIPPESVHLLKWVWKFSLETCSFPFLFYLKSI